jgi:membrane protease YdiL (CAAX protease family)
MINDRNINSEFNPEPTRDSQEESNDKVNSKFSPIFAAFVGLIGGFFLYQIIGGLITTIIIGMDIDKASVNSLRLMTIAGQLLFILLPALIFTKYFYENIDKIIRLRIPSSMEIILFTIGMFILTPLLQSYLYIQNYFIEILAQNFPLINEIKIIFDHLNQLVDKTYSNLLQAKNIFEFFFVVIVVAFVPSFSEEFMFRGFIQRSFEQKLKPMLAALITAVFFSSFHFNPYGFVPLAFLGFYFGLAAYYSKSLIIPIFLHFINNFSAISIYHILGSKELISSDVKPELSNLSSYIFAVIILGILFSVLLYSIKKYYSQQKIK